MSDEQVEIVGAAPSVGALWTPIVGSEALRVVDSLQDEEGKKRVLDESIAILGRCVSPTVASGRRTGLVIGYVQSGKTLSFTTVAGLARDNGYRLVIVIAGTSVPLFEQSKKRLTRDLGLGTLPRGRWVDFWNPTTVQRRTALKAALDSWASPLATSLGSPSVFVGVMKHHGHLRNLKDLLASLDLHGVPALIIDDEADQASLNTLVNRDDESTTYARLVELRSWLPHHTFLQYTATPQAPLLINLIDTLSPQFVELVTPGAAYVGGHRIFGENPNLVRTIPLDEIPTKSHPLTEPPGTLLEALRLFYLGVALGFKRHEHDEGNRSMLVHPSQRTQPQRQFRVWVESISRLWNDTLSLPPGDPDRDELLEDFALAYADLTATVEDVPAFETLVPFLVHAVSTTGVHEVNATPGRSPSVEWNQVYGNILVGGQAMDRGFTVEGLTVTYMPREVGVGNADTVQQRARFFGYKDDYLGLIRVFLHPQVAEVYRRYVEHEEDIRRRLREHRATGRPLREWRRAFFLDRSLRPTRASVLDLGYTRMGFADQWVRPKAPHHSSSPDDNPVAINRSLVDDLLSSVGPLVDDPRDHRARRSGLKRVMLAREVSLGHVYRELLSPLAAFHPFDSAQQTELLLQLDRYLERFPSAVCTVMLMDGGATRNREEEPDDGTISLHQGPDPADGSVYPGDAALRDNVVTVQIHQLNIRRGGIVSVPDVPAIAVWVPRSIGRDVLMRDPVG